jgi:hypothetical protein
MSDQQIAEYNPFPNCFESALWLQLARHIAYLTREVHRDLERADGSRMSITVEKRWAKWHDDMAEACRVFMQGQDQIITELQRLNVEREMLRVVPMQIVPPPPVP